VFKLYDTFGFPLDLTELMARERGYSVDVDGFEAALERQRERSRADRAASDLGVSEDSLAAGWVEVGGDHGQTFVGYDRREVDTVLLAVRVEGEPQGLILKENPFYLESGGQVSDSGVVEGDGWKFQVDDVARVGDRSALLGAFEGELPGSWSDVGLVSARVHPRFRHDTERNHTATHLLHAALRDVLGTHVVQRGSLVAPDRLRFDFAHTAPMTGQELEDVERRVNDGIWEDHGVEIGRMAYSEAVQAGAMALFGEKYGDEVRVVRVPEISMELCGGTHVRHTGEIGLFKIVGESGVAAGVRRIEAVTGPGAYRFFREEEERLRDVARTLRTPAENAPNRARQILEEKKQLEDLLADLRKGGTPSDALDRDEVQGPGGEPVTVETGELRALGADDARASGDRFREEHRRSVRVVTAELGGDKRSLFAFVTDDVVGMGLRADVLVREVAELVGGRGGGRPHMAQASVGDPERLPAALQEVPAIVARLLRPSDSA
jgi:alanyl-tRNA synthetase